MKSSIFFNPSLTNILEITYCPPVEDDALGTWDCPAGDKMFYEEGDMCNLICPPSSGSRFGGYVLCSSTGKWDESGKKGCV